LWTLQSKEKFKDFDESVAMKHVNVDVKNSNEHLKHVKVATAMVICPPTNPDWAT